MNKRSCVLLLRDAHELNAAAIDGCGDRLNLLATTYSSAVDEDELARLHPDLVISFLNNHILRGPLLRFHGVNFHPAPPKYPGRGGASRAIYNGDTAFGATAHRIVAKIDAGQIVAVDRFEIDPDNTCADIYRKAEQSCLALLKTIVMRFAETGEVGWQFLDERWGEPMTRRQFENWLVIRDPADKEEVDRKIRAAKHPRFPGPYIELHGHRFAYAPAS
jgi:methionyl-tRNA formyltransferase